MVTVDALNARSALNLSLVCKLKALSCSEVSSEGAGEAERESRPRSMLAAKIRISGTLMSLSLRLETPPEFYNFEPKRPTFIYL